MIVKLRAATAADFDFLYQLRQVTMKPCVQVIWGWDELAQQQRFANSFNLAISQIIVVDGRDIDELIVEKREDVLYPKGIYILPAY